MSNKSRLQPTGQIAHRFASAGPTSYDAASHSCTLVISAGAAVKRFYGIEKLRVDRASVDLSRIASSGVPFLDSHSQAGINAILGRVDHAWIEGDKLLGKVTFAQTPQGKLAEKMVATGMLKAVSAGYTVSEWSISDPDGNPVNTDRMHWDDTENTFEGTRWQLLEVSAVGVPADADSAVRSFGGAAMDDLVDDVLVRMQARQRMQERQTAYDGRRAVTDTSDQHAWQRGRASSVFP